MTYYRPLKAYRETTTRSASPGQLVLMLFDGALRFMNLAVEGFGKEDFIQRSEQIHNNLQKTQAILTELQATLNLEVGGEFGQTMYRLYDFMQEQLRQANMKKEREPIQIVQGLLREIRDAWAQMLEESNRSTFSSGIELTC